MTDEVYDIERDFAALNEAIAQIGLSMRRVNERVQEMGCQIDPTIHPQHQIAIFRWD